MSIPSVAFVLLLCIITLFTIDIQARDDVSGEHELGRVAGSNPPFIPKFQHEVTDTCKCGNISNQRIVGGVEAKSGRWCWQVKLKIFDDLKAGKYRPCGGAIINDKYILSAAHCFYRYHSLMYGIYIGSHKLEGDINEQKVAIESIQIHPGYDPANYAYDLALVKLVNKIEYTDRICSVCLPHTKNNIGENCTVTGWGHLTSGGTLANKLMETVVKIIPKDICAQQYSYLHSSSICAAAPGSDSCQGDSGGPMVHKTDKDTWELVGIVSHGIGCANPNFAGVYADVYECVPWIYKHTQDSKFCARS